MQRVLPTRALSGASHPSLGLPMFPSTTILSWLPPPPADFHSPWAPPVGCTDDSPCLPADASPLWKERVTFIQGVPTEEATLEKVRGLLKEWNATTVLVSEDSDHSYEHALGNARAYAPFVSKGSYLLIQDTKVTRWHKSSIACGNLPSDAEQDACWATLKAGPLDSVHDFLAENKDFAMDRSMEYLIYTQHARGFLKRVQSPH
jgi:cephalosporin hydroxylase